ncbi:hypothetical protein ACFQY0_04615 [Haloferula chungangensis]|uniref:Outer membrane protein beta-barrel domain-containing protein n=1 Tax=Haloferula chungangensis TaxID=1048331 RepID=A0ABW2L284_9BACT
MKLRTVLTSVALLSAPAFAGTPDVEPVLTPAPSASDGWEFRLAIYGPMMGMDGTVGVGPVVGTVDIPFSEILESLDGGFFSSFEARGNRWSINGDIMWLKMSSSSYPGPNSYLGFKQEQFMSTLTTGFELYEDESTVFDIFGGLAVTSLDVDVDFTTFPALRPPVSRTIGGSETWIDPIVGLRARHRFADNWSVFGSASYGGFGVGSDEYWQLIGGIAYHMTEHSSIALAYRGIGVDYRDDNFLYNTKTYGPNLGIMFRF